MDSKEKSHVEVAIEVSSDDQKESEGLIRSHCLLRGGRPNYHNYFSARQMESLTALCDTLVPSLLLDSNGLQDDDDAVRSFYGTSASEAGVPENLAGFMCERLVHAALGLMSLSLWLLSTWYGTFIMCGTLSLSGHFPYFQRFSQVVHHQREQILRSWSHSSWGLFRLMFKGIKFLCLFCFYSKVDEKNQNPSWRAIGYCGPDPEFLKNINKTTEEDRYGPLANKIIDMEQAGDNIMEILLKAGFNVIDGVSRIEKLWKQRGLILKNTVDMKKKPLTIKCDAVVVGSGAGGGVVAGVLAQAGYKVLVLEKGKYYARSNLSLLEGPSLDQMYEGGGLLATDDIGVVLLAGSTVGGGSSVNWSTSLRTPLHVLQEWSEKLQLTQFSSKSYTDAMDIVCQRMGVQEEICNESDELNLRKGIEKVLRIMVAAGAQEIGTHHCSGDRFKVQGSNPDDVEKFIKRTSSRRLRDLSTPLCSAHQMGSCRMGVERHSSVVDPRCETWEVEKLFVADASVLPTALGVNPMVTIQSIAYCTAQFVLESLKNVDSIG